MPRPAMWNNLAFVLVNAGLNWTFVFGGPFQYAPIGYNHLLLTTYYLLLTTDY